MRANPALLGALLLMQTGCVGMAMSVANADEVNDRRAIKQWIWDQPAYRECKKRDARSDIAPIRMYDFDHDGHQELVVTAASCLAGTDGPDVHAVLSRTADGSFSTWPIEPLSKKYAGAEEFVGNRHYRLEVVDGKLIARWQNRAKSKTLLTVTYKPVDDGFAIDDVRVGH